MQAATCFLGAVPVAETCNVRMHILISRGFWVWTSRIFSNILECFFFLKFWIIPELSFYKLQPGCAVSVLLTVRSTITNDWCTDDFINSCAFFETEYALYKSDLFMYNTLSLQAVQGSFTFLNRHQSGYHTVEISLSAKTCTLLFLSLLL